MNGVLYKEYISKTINANGNYTEDIIDFIELDKETPNKENLYI
jgi:hypothetical protein